MPPGHYWREMGAGGGVALSFLVVKTKKLTYSNMQLVGQKNKAHSFEESF